MVTDGGVGYVISSVLLLLYKIFYGILICILKKYVGADIYWGKKKLWVVNSGLFPVGILVGGCLVSEGFGAIF